MSVTLKMAVAFVGPDEGHHNDSNPMPNTLTFGVVGKMPKVIAKGEDGMVYGDMLRDSMSDVYGNVMYMSKYGEMSHAHGSFWGIVHIAIEEVVNGPAILFIAL